MHEALMKRRRKHIPLIELLASALADKLPQLDRDMLRRERAPAQAIVRMFTPDHIILHAWDGPAVWWNLDMRRRNPTLKAKDAADTKRAAKVKRIERKETKWRNRKGRTRTAMSTNAQMSGPPRLAQKRWARRPFPKVKRHWPSRPFPRRNRGT